MPDNWEWDEDVLIGDSQRNHNGKGNGKGKNPEMFWDEDFGGITDTDIDRILSIPPITDMAGIFARGNFKTDDERIRYLRVTRRLEKFGLKSRLEFIRSCVASKIGMMAFGKTLQLQTKVQLIAPAVIREQLAMRRVKAKEENMRGSDFRQDTESKEPKQMR